MFEISSMENKTPPIGLPNATATPAALEATNMFLKVNDELVFEGSRLSKILEIILPTQTA